LHAFCQQIGCKGVPWNFPDPSLENPGYSLWRYCEADLWLDLLKSAVLKGWEISVLNIQCVETCMPMVEVTSTKFHTFN